MHNCMSICCADGAHPGFHSADLIPALAVYHPPPSSANKRQMVHNLANIDKCFTLVCTFYISYITGQARLGLYWSRVSTFPAFIPVWAGINQEAVL